MALKRVASLAVIALCLLPAAGCASRGGGDGPAVFTSQSNDGGGLRLFGGRGGGRASAQNNAAIGVNAYLWRASLDTIAFMPLASADPYGGVIISDWYTNPEQPTERFKVTIYILDTRLRADGLNVTVFKQTKGLQGEWLDAAATAQTETDMENAILTRARQLRLANLR